MRGSILGAFPRRRVHERHLLVERNSQCAAHSGGRHDFAAAFAVVPARARRERLRRAYPRPSHPTSPPPSSPVRPPSTLASLTARPPPFPAPSPTRGAATRARAWRSATTPLLVRSSGSVRDTAGVHAARRTVPPRARSRRGPRGGARGTKSIEAGLTSAPITCTAGGARRGTRSRHRARLRRRSGHEPSRRDHPRPWSPRRRSRKARCATVSSPRRATHPSRARVTTDFALVGKAGERPRRAAGAAVAAMRSLARFVRCSRTPASSASRRSMGL